MNRFIENNINWSIRLFVVLALTSCDYVFEDASQNYFNQNQELELNLWQNDFLVIVSTQNLQLNNLVTHHSNNISNNELDQKQLDELAKNSTEIQLLLKEIAKIKNVSVPCVATVSMLNQSNLNHIEDTLSGILSNQLSAIRTLQKFSNNKLINVSLKKMEQLIELNQLILENKD